MLYRRGFELWYQRENRVQWHFKYCNHSSRLDDRPGVRNLPHENSVKWHLEYHNHSSRQGDMSGFRNLPNEDKVLWHLKYHNYSSRQADRPGVRNLLHENIPHEQFLDAINNVGNYWNDLHISSVVNAENLIHLIITVSFSAMDFEPFSPIWKAIRGEGWK